MSHPVHKYSLSTELNAQTVSKTKTSLLQDSLQNFQTHRAKPLSPAREKLLSPPPSTATSYQAHFTEHGALFAATSLTRSHPLVPRYIISPCRIPATMLQLRPRPGNTRARTVPNNKPRESAGKKGRARMTCSSAARRARKERSFVSLSLSLSLPREGANRLPRRERTYKWGQLRQCRLIQTFTLSARLCTSYMRAHCCI